MAKGIWESPPKRDDPIFKSGLTVYTPRSARSSTPSTPSSPQKTDSRPAQGSNPQKAQSSNRGAQER